MRANQNELQTQIHYRLMERLSASERNHRELIERLQEIVFKADHSGHLLFLNSSWTKILGYETKASIGHPLSAFIAEDYRASFSILLERLKAEKTIAHQELCFQHQKGECIWLEFSAYYDTEDVYSGLLHDITERKKTELLLQETNRCLAESLEQLKNFQIQMIQSEKMASLGNLVAGVAHEINNPLGFLEGSIENAKDYSQDLFDHLKLYQRYYPHPETPVQKNAEQIDLEFLCEDFPKIFEAMQSACDRIQGISTSLRTFSRADTEYKVSVNLNEGIDSTLLILKYRLKANEHRPAIEVIQDYGNLPSVNCFPGQLNQVFMNILANAIDMFDEMAQIQSFEDIESCPQQITVRTTPHANQVEIQISDNGKGMPEDLMTRIFDHLFTTKGVGKGTGLGLAIARQIVVEKHSGSLDVHSEVGQGTQFCIRLPIEG